MTKKLGEVWAKLIDGVCLRVWNAYGVLEPQDIKSHVISDFVYNAVKFGKIKMLTTGEEWRQFTHLDDIYRAFHLAMTSKDINRTVYDVCSYELVQIKQVAEIVSKFTKAKIIPGKINKINPTKTKIPKISCAVNSDGSIDIIKLKLSPNL